MPEIEFRNAYLNDVLIRFSAKYDESIRKGLNQRRPAL